MVPLDPDFDIKGRFGQIFVGLMLVMLVAVIGFIAIHAFS